MGHMLLREERARGWGAKVIEQLSRDLQNKLPGVRGLSPRNLRYMRDTAAAFPEDPIWQQLLPNCPWTHITAVVSRLDTARERAWYLRSAIDHGWTRAHLEAQIATRLIDRQGSAPTNFERTLPSPQSELAQEILKDPYELSLVLVPDAVEREVEAEMVANVEKVLMELGKGFAFYGRQKRFVVDDQEFFVDLLFFHVQLQCFVVVELKMSEFIPEYAGKLYFYLAIVDDQLRDPLIHRPTIGILLCPSKSDVIVEYALQQMGKPMGVSELRLSSTLPPELAERLPTASELAASFPASLMKRDD